jgi:hypothetical protein
MDDVGAMMMGEILYKILDLIEPFRKRLTIGIFHLHHELRILTCPLRNEHPNMQHSPFYRASHYSRLIG